MLSDDSDPATPDGAALRPSSEAGGRQRITATAGRQPQTPAFQCRFPKGYLLGPHLDRSEHTPGYQPSPVVPQVSGKVESCRTAVAFRSRSSEHIHSPIGREETIRLVLQPSNKTDSKAVVVMLDINPRMKGGPAYHIGYLPRGPTKGEIYDHLETGRICVSGRVIDEEVVGGIVMKTLVELTAKPGPGHKSLPPNVFGPIA